MSVNVAMIFAATASSVYARASKFNAAFCLSGFAFSMAETTIVTRD
jgi:hypothetical protein